MPLGEDHTRTTEPSPASTIQKNDRSECRHPGPKWHAKSRDGFKKLQYFDHLIMSILISILELIDRGLHRDCSLHPTSLGIHQYRTLAVHIP